eukprot:NODE_3688_length_1176_cov_100.979107_g3503_i0.p1 GENE.NODE_3688_length_1176_cov_100.979107_g3503_i0~~NODE_3688_length_1176_cov_100.979107_g3503_i0.p1  ORF type:complete len:340 (+),score=45.65 NODE_3688_length_1176_cov_100.979107_g3503_i0:80-1099(+)
MRYLVSVTVDDFGVNAGRDAGIIHAFQKGLVNRASLMVNGEDPRRAVALAKNIGMLNNLGLHVNVTEGVPISATTAVPSLIGSDGRFLGKEGFFEKAHAQQLNATEVAIEIKAQLQLFKQLTGFAARHADGHHHAHMFTCVAPIFAQVFSECGVQSTRVAEDLPLLHTLGEEVAVLQESPVSNEDRWNGMPFYLLVCKESAKARALYSKVGIRCNDLFAGMGMMGANNSVSKMLSLVASRFTCFAVDPTAEKDDHADCHTIKADGGDSVRTVEIMTHPGFDPRECAGVQAPKQLDAFWHCYFDLSADRSHEVAVLTDSELVQYVSKQPDLRFVDWTGEG